ncbi:Flagellar hook-length control [Fusarium acuminatum]|uniref:Flagellar hook-length control n=1 Tax=Fusarium acuminatum TaxID=5515 RepID=A0ABZ2X703_9HYPO
MGKYNKNKQTHSQDAKNTNRNSPPRQIARRSNNVVTLTRRDEECRLILDILTSYFAPFEIPRFTNLIEHRPWHANGIYTTHSAEPILPDIWDGLTVRIVKFDQERIVQVYLAIAGSLNNAASIPSAELLRVAPYEYIMDTGVKVSVQIEDSVHGKWLAACMMELGVLAYSWFEQCTPE